ncbi:MAG: ATP-binding protein [Candidatus Eisenbacteria bacterium]
MKRWTRSGVRGKGSALFEFVLGVLFYFGTGQLASLLAAGDSLAAPLWPPAALGVAWIWICGYSRAPGVFLGALLSDSVTVAQHPGMALGPVLAMGAYSGVSATLEASVCVWLLRRVRFDPTSPAGVLRFLLAAAASAGLAAGLAVLGVLLSHTDTDSIAGFWVTWFLGDLTAMALIAPGLFLWRHRLCSAPTGQRPESSSGRVAVILLAALTILGILDPHLATVCFLAQAALLFWPGIRLDPRQTMTSLLLAATCAIVGRIGRGGTYSTIEAAPVWIGTDLALALLSAIVWILSTRRWRAEQRSATPRVESTEARHTPPRVRTALATALVCLAATLAAWHSIRNEELRTIHANMRNLATTITNEMERETEHRVRALERMRARWELRGGTPRGEWEQDAANVIRDSVGQTALEWADASGTIRWVVPMAGNEAALNFDLNCEPLRAGTLAEARATRTTRVSPVLTLKQGGAGFLVVTPLYPDGRFDGYLLAVFRLSGLATLPSGDLLKDVALMVREDGTLVYQSGEPTRDSSLRAFARHMFHCRNVEWEFEVAPTDRSVLAGRSKAAAVVVGIGTLFSALLSLLVFLREQLQVKAKREEQVTCQLRDANARLEEEQERALAGTRAKSQFLATMSHEIRTPLNGIIGMTDLLARTPLSAEQQEEVATIHVSSMALLAVVNDILDFSKIEAGQVEVESIPFAPREVGAQVATLLAEQARQKGIDFSTHVDEALPSWVEGDPAKLRQVLLNLASNAIKFTSHGEVRVEITLAARKDTACRIGFHVRDTGVGIKAEHFDRIFAPFSQADASTTRRFGGTGLGLAICRELVERMGGKLEVESEVDQGSHFFFKLELPTLAGDHEAGRADTASITLNGVRVLLTEDNLVNQKVVSRMLTRLGCTVSIAEDGARAVEMARGEHFDFVLMDCQMPVMDGFEATAAIRALSDGHGAMPIVALTANATSEDRRQCLAAGMDDFLAKPIQLEQLRAALARWSNREPRAAA